MRCLSPKYYLELRGLIPIRKIACLSRRTYHNVKTAAGRQVQKLTTCLLRACFLAMTAPAASDDRWPRAGGTPAFGYFGVRKTPSSRPSAGIATSSDIRSGPHDARHRARTWLITTLFRIKSRVGRDRLLTRSSAPLEPCVDAVLDAAPLPAATP